MTTLVRRGLASSILGACSLALALAGCGGGGPNPTPDPTSTPSGTGTPTAGPTATRIPGTGGSNVKDTEIVYVSGSSSDASDLYKSTITGTTPVRLTGRNTTVDNPSVSNDGARLVFQFGTTSPTDGNDAINIELGLANTNGSGYRPLTTDSTDTGRPDDYAPFFSPDGQYIFWTSTRGGTDASGNPVDKVPHIWRMSGQQGSTGRNQTQVTFEPSAYPSVSANGTLAYFAFDKRTTTPIAITTVSNPTQVRYVGAPVSSTQSAFGVSLALSPDGKRVAYSAVTPGQPAADFVGIRIYNVTTGAVETTLPIVAKGANHARAWSRDSQTLFLDALTLSGTRQIFTSQAPFSTTTQVTTGVTSSYSPALLPGTN